jgi:large subunit ribosomal protein L24e
MPTCSFCKKLYKEPRGLTVFTFDGRSVYYCSSKCRRNAALKRDPKKTNWVKKGKHYADYLASEKTKQNLSNDNPKNKKVESQENVSVE